MPETDDFLSAEIISRERAALDRWGRGDPEGFIEIFAEGVTYFDPALERRLDGFTALRDHLAPLTGKIKIDRYEMVEPRVQRHGDAAVLTFNLINYGKREDGTEEVRVRWNSTEVYALIEGKWKIVHSHWSYIKPELKQPLSV
jgi:ketosteroid isomerase-like protein